MHRYSFQAMDESGEPVADEIVNQTRTEVSEDTIRSQARSIAEEVANEFWDKAPWAGRYIQIYSRVDYGSWDEREILFDDLMGEQEPDYS